MNITTGSGKKVSARSLTYYRFADGKIAEDDTITTPDLAQLLSGAMPAPVEPARR
jgi:hypothetical protein